AVARHHAEDARREAVRVDGVIAHARRPQPARLCDERGLSADRREPPLAVGHRGEVIAERCRRSGVAGARHARSSRRAFRVVARRAASGGVRIGPLAVIWLAAAIAVVATAALGFAYAGKRSRRAAGPIVSPELAARLAAATQALVDASPWQPA